MDLLLITHKFPYGHDFIDGEIPFLAREFDRVYVISVAKKHDAPLDSPEMKAKIPPNFTVIAAHPGKVSFPMFAKACARLFRDETADEAAFAGKLGYKDKFAVVKHILKYYYYDEMIRAAADKLPLDPKRTFGYSYWASMCAYALRGLKNRGRVCFAMTRAHGYDAYIERNYIAFRREVLSDLDLVVPISEAGGKSIAEKLMVHIEPRKRAEIFVSRLGVTNEGGARNPDCCPHPFHIVTCGRMIALKRHDLLVRALAKLDIPFEWTAIGDGEKLAEVKALADELLGGRENAKVNFLGYVKNPEVLRMYAEKHIDVFVNCSDTEGIPFSIMEAMSFGIPAVARDVGGCGEVVDSSCGRLIPTEESADALAEAVAEIAALGAEEKAAMRDAAFERWKERYSIGHNSAALVEKMRRVYDDKNRN